MILTQHQQIEQRSAQENVLMSQDGELHTLFGIIFLLNRLILIFYYSVEFGNLALGVMQGWTMAFSLWGRVPNLVVPLMSSLEMMHNF